jgi:hypothetical protein
MFSLILIYKAYVFVVRFGLQYTEYNYIFQSISVLFLIIAFTGSVLLHLEWCLGPLLRLELFFFQKFLPLLIRLIAHSRKSYQFFFLSRPGTSNVIIGFKYLILIIVVVNFFCMDIDYYLNKVLVSTDLLTILPNMTVLLWFIMLYYLSVQCVAVIFLNLSGSSYIRDDLLFIYAARKLKSYFLLKYKSCLTLDIKNKKVK